MAGGRRSGGPQPLLAAPPGHRPGPDGRADAEAGRPADANGAPGAEPAGPLLFHERGPGQLYRAGPLRTGRRFTGPEAVSAARSCPGALGTRGPKRMDTVP